MTERRRERKGNAAAFLSNFNRNKKKTNAICVAVGVDSVAHRHPLINVWETLSYLNRCIFFF